MEAGMVTDMVRLLPIISSVASLTAILSSMTVRLCIISSVASRAGVVLFRNPASWILKSFSAVLLAVVQSPSHFAR